MEKTTLGLHSNPEVLKIRGSGKMARPPHEDEKMIITWQDAAKKTGKKIFYDGTTTQ